MFAGEPESAYILCRRADEAIRSSREIAAQARADVKLAKAYLHHEAYADGWPRLRHEE